MTPSEAAEIYRTTKPKLEELADELKQLAEAEKVLKSYAKDHPEKRSYKKIAFTRGSQRRFNILRAKELLGDKRAAECVLPVETVSLTLT